MSIRKAHYVSGLFMSLFIVLHLLNHAYSILGEQSHIAIMTLLRQVYRNIFIELILLSTVIVQIYSGMKLFHIKCKIAADFYEKLHIWSGLYLAFFLVIHISAVLVGRLILHLDTNFYFGVAGINTFPFNLFFVPYYSLAIFSYFGHIAAIHVKKMRKNILGYSPHSQAKAILIFGFCFMLIVFYGLTGKFNGVDIPSEYKVLIGK